MEIVYNPQKEKWNEICSRLTTSYSENELVVKKIFEDVKNKGDEALTKYTLKYDNVLTGKYKSNSDIGVPSLRYFDQEVKKYCYMRREGGQFSTEKYNLEKDFEKKQTNS